MPDTRISIIFRALNEEKWFDDALVACRGQRLPKSVDLEIVLVDSGSTDDTLDIAKRHGVRIVHIKKSEFTFGRSLNFGCEAATGDVLVFISAHCIPQHDRWLANLVEPVLDGVCDYSYGRQVGHEVSRFSEHQVFAHFFGERDRLPQEGFFCNNANAAIRAAVWRKHRFDESVTGLEDMVLAKAVVAEGGRVGYVSDAPVIHIHEETLTQTWRRYYREALTLREIMPEVHFDYGDMLRCFFAGVFTDFGAALEQRRFVRETPGILTFRFMQYWGALRGHKENRALSRAEKERYYYPRARKIRPNREPGLIGARVLAEARQTPISDRRERIQL